MEQKIKEYFAAHREALLRDIGTLIAIPSVEGEAEEGKPFGPGPAAALAAAMKIAQDMGFAVKNYENYAATVDFGTLPAGLDILAHLDVVPAGHGWQVTEPFQPLLREGKLYGRGTADDKGPAIAALYAMKAVRDLGVPLQKNVRLVLGTNEETGSRDLTYYYEREKEAPMTFSPDAAFPVINIEKGRYSLWLSANYAEESALPRICSAKGGVVSNVVPDAAEAILEGFLPEALEQELREAEARTGLRFQWKALEDGRIAVGATGTCAHASTPQEGNNAVTGLLDFLASLPCADSEGFQKLTALHRLFPHGDCEGKAAGVAMEDACSGKLTLSVDIFRFEQGELRCFFDSRVPVCATNENLRDVFVTKAKALGLTPEAKDVSPAHNVPADSPFIRTLLHAYEQYSGRKGECIAIGGGTYCHRLANGVAFGCCLPETDNHMHGPDEYAVVEELLMGAEIFTQAIIDLCC